MAHDVYRNGKVHVMQEMCATCIFRPGNLMNLEEGRVSQMAKEAMAKESCIVCHQTLDKNNACCRGFFDRHKTQPLQIAERMGAVSFVNPESS